VMHSKHALNKFRGTENQSTCPQLTKLTAPNLYFFFPLNLVSELGRWKAIASCSFMVNFKQIVVVMGKMKRYRHNYIQKQKHNIRREQHLKTGIYTKEDFWSHASNQ
jgi:hypothetical protein